MDIKDCIKSRKLFKDLSDEERFEIVFLRRKHYSLNAIAYQLGRSPSTILQEKFKTEDFLTKKHRKNNGEIPQYYVKIVREKALDTTSLEAKAKELNDKLDGIEVVWRK